MQTFQDPTKMAVFERIISGEYFVENIVTIAGIRYEDPQIISLYTELNTADTTTMVGNAVSGSIDIEVIKQNDTIPRMATIKLFCRVTNFVETSDDIPMGVYYVDTRSETHRDDNLDCLHLTGYDAMLKTEQDYAADIEFPATDIDVVEDIAHSIGIEVDDRTYQIMTAGYSVQLPIQYTMREILAYIASMYAGNFIINPSGQLRLVRINEMPVETNYLVSEHGNAITFGGVRILV